MIIQNFKVYANNFYKLWERAVTTNKPEKDFNGNQWVKRRKLQPLGIAKFFNFFKKGSCSLENSQKITAKLLGKNNFQELLKLQKTNNEEFKLDIIILSNCTNITSYLLWKYYTEKIVCSYAKASFQDKLKIANSYFPSLPEQKKKRIKSSNTYEDEIPNGSEFDADYHMFD